MDASGLTENEQGKDTSEETFEPPYYQQEIDIVTQYNLYQIKCGDNYVSDEIGDAYKRWSSVLPVFISAQTGQGKNYFIETVLIPHVEKKRKEEHRPCKILILSNRIALNLQTKIRIMDKLGFKSEREELSDKGILNRTEIGHVTILQYQGLLGALKHLQPYEYAYVVCDECHFFTSDAMFNPYTGATLDAITRFFSNSVRIYMTATFDDCIKYICHRENELLAGNYISRERFIDMQALETDGKGLFYTLYCDYSYLDTHYFTDYSSLIPIITESDDKWLIFIDDKEKCKELAEELTLAITAKIKVTKQKDTSKNPKYVKVIDSTSKEDVEYLEILKSEKFESKVLISTSVIDNGVNLKDEKLTNVIITDINKAKCLQMLGRVRVNSDIKINLYIKEFDEEYLKKRIKDIERQVEAYDLYAKAYTSNRRDVYEARFYFNQKFYNGRENDFRDAKHWFYRESHSLESVRLNYIAKDLAYELLNKYRSILQEMTDIGNGKNYLIYQLSWFKQVYDEKRDITIQGATLKQAEFINFILGYIGKVMPKDRTDTFRQEFTEKFISAYGRRKKEDGFEANDNPAREAKYGKNIINEILRMRANKIGKELYIEAQKDGWLIVENQV